MLWRAAARAHARESYGLKDEGDAPDIAQQRGIIDGAAPAMSVTRLLCSTRGFYALCQQLDMGHMS